MRLSKLAHRFRFPIGTLMLMLTVVGWGIEYKTSLYAESNPLPVASSIPARLLSDGEKGINWNEASPWTGPQFPAEFASPLASTAEHLREPECGESQLLVIPEEDAREQRPDGRFYLRGPPSV